MENKENLNETLNETQDYLHFKHSYASERHFCLCMGTEGARRGSCNCRAESDKEGCQGHK